MVSETIIFCFIAGEGLKGGTEDDIYFPQSTSLAAATLTDFRDGDHKMGRARVRACACTHT